MILEKPEKVRNKFSANRVIKYINFDIPITCLKEIMLGPLTNEDIMEPLSSIVLKLNTSKQIKVTKSKLAIQ